MVVTCYESIEDSDIPASSPIISEQDEGFAFEDGACCENSMQGSVCCIIMLNEAVAIRLVIHRCLFDFI